MWNEKKFFQDFVEESEKVKPDEEFVQQLKKMTNKNEVEKIHKRRLQVCIVKYVTVAASFLLCFVIGSIAWNAHNSMKENNDETDSYTADAHAGNKNHGIQSGIIGEELDLETVIAVVSDETVIVEDENGEEILAGKRKLLLKLLNKAQKTDEDIDLKEEYTSYICKGEKEIEIKIYNGEYIVIGNSDIVYRVN